MSEILARIRVRETAGIRRFLYPLTAIAAWPVQLKVGDFKSWQEMYGDVGLETDTGHSAPEIANGSAVPSQIIPLNGTANAFNSRIDFAVWLLPGATQDILVKRGGLIAAPLDPLRLSPTPDGGMRNVQERFAITVGPDGLIQEVNYDSTAHMRGTTRVTRNGETAWLSFSTVPTYDNLLLAAEVNAKSKYTDGCFAQTRTTLTACKSWATMTHRLEQPKRHDEIVFTLPLAVTSPTLTCDFGVGGGIYGKLQPEDAPEVVWRTGFGNATHNAGWSVATAGQTDYVGTVGTAEAFLPQRWFHLIDSDKALAVAITKIPSDCREMTVRLTHLGDVAVAFRLGETVSGPAEFGVCYHFLNDVPAIAAATNPQSILLPPVVEVLPV